MRTRDVCPLTLPELALDTERHEIIVYSRIMLINNDEDNKKIKQLINK